MKSNKLKAYKNLLPFSLAILYCSFSFSYSFTSDITVPEILVSEILVSEKVVELEKSYDSGVTLLRKGRSLLFLNEEGSVQNRSGINGSIIEEKAEFDVDSIKISLGHWPLIEYDNNLTTKSIIRNLTNFILYQAEYLERAKDHSEGLDAKGLAKLLLADVIPEDLSFHPFQDIGAPIIHDINEIISGVKYSKPGTFYVMYKENQEDKSAIFTHDIIISLGYNLFIDVTDNMVFMDSQSLSEFIQNSYNAGFKWYKNPKAMKIKWLKEMSGAVMTFISGLLLMKCAFRTIP